MAVAEYIKNIDMSAFVYDYDHNAETPEDLQRTHKPFFDVIRKQNPNLPIIMMTRPCGDLDAEDMERRRRIVLDTYENAVASGDKNVYFVDGKEMFGKEERHACTMDLIHPTDLGFMRMAEYILPTLKKALEGQNMKLTLLGTSHGVPSDTRFTSCYMLEVNDSIYIFDGGAPVVDLLLRKKKDLSSVKAFFNTHLHGDHIFGAVSMFSLFEWYYKDTDMDVFLPDEKSKDALVEFIRTVENVELPSMRVRLTAYSSGVIFKDENIRVTAIPVKHFIGKEKKSYAFFIEAEGKSLLYTGDMSSTLEDFPQITRERFINCIISEAAHCAPERLLQCMHEVNTDLFIVSHIWPLDKIETIEKAADQFRFKIHIACDNDEFVI